MSEYIVNGCGCISNATVYGLDESIKRAKYPMSSDINELNTSLTQGIKNIARCVPGSGHDQWLTGVIVQFDLTFSIKAFVEAERYHFLDFVSSQSTMHRITSFDLDEAYNEYVDIGIIEIMKEKVAYYNRLSNELDELLNSGGTSEDELGRIESKRKARDETYLEILYSNPVGFKLTAGMTTNYRQLKTIYSQRKNHKLPEWREFCNWIKELPLSELIVGD